MTETSPYLHAQDLFTAGLRLAGSRWHDLCLVGLAAAPLPAVAQLSLTTAASTQYEHNSNIFALQHGYTVPGVSTPPYDDSVLAYGGKLDTTYLWGQQQVRADLSATQYRYDRFGRLNHDSYTLDGAWKWRLGAAFDGLVAITHVRSMVDLYNVNQPELVLRTEQRETGKVGIRLPSDWRAEVSAYTEHDREPQFNARHLSLTETGGQAAIKYLGTAGVTTGLSAGYLHGDFSGVDATTAPAYHQTDVALTASYIGSEISAFAGRLGYSRRASATAVAGGINSISGVTWDLDYRRALTGKTTAEVQVSRLITSYITNTGSVITSFAAIKLNWQATYKLAIALDYNFTYRQMPGQGGTFAGALNGSERVDRFNFTGLAVNYEALTWLSLRPYVRFQNRTSKHFAGGDFDATVVGVQFTLQWERGAPPAPTLFAVPD